MLKAQTQTLGSHAGRKSSPNMNPELQFLLDDYAAASTRIITSKQRQYDIEHQIVVMLAKTGHYDLMRVNWARLHHEMTANKQQ